MQKDDKKVSTQKGTSKTIVKNGPKTTVKSASKNTGKNPVKHASSTKKGWYKDPRFYFLGVLYCLMVFLFIQLVMIGVIPMKYTAVAVVLLALCAWAPIR